VLPPPEPVRVTAPRSAELAPAPPKLTLPPLPEQPPAASGPPTPKLLLPLVAVNRVADALFWLLGPLGKTFRTEPGRNLFGVAGLVLLAYTAAHVAQVQGWLALPFPLPWPR
jgi:hypothetical protein